MVLSQGGAEISLPIAKDRPKVLGGAVGSESFCYKVFGRNMAKMWSTWNLWTSFTFGASLQQHKDLVFPKVSVVADLQCVDGKV